ncbi:hypothetical protein C8F01DRAFT_1245334 [Mycena amicta]|nr:hypothetical protein C8F01DRAFT_1245334 [Mycena amicta]
MLPAVRGRTISCSCRWRSIDDTRDIDLFPSACVFSAPYPTTLLRCFDPLGSRLEAPASRRRHNQLTNHQWDAQTHHLLVAPLEHTHIIRFRLVIVVPVDSSQLQYHRQAALHSLGFEDPTTENGSASGSDAGTLYWRWSTMMCLCFGLRVVREEGTTLWIIGVALNRTLGADGEESGKAYISVVSAVAGARYLLLSKESVFDISLDRRRPPSCIDHPLALTTLLH